MSIFELETKLFKAIADTTRLKILDVLSCGEVCACDILNLLTISQPTLSHHMKVLLDVQLIKSRKDATWVYYSINYESFSELKNKLDKIINPKDECLCKVSDKENCKKEK